MLLQKIFGEDENCFENYLERKIYMPIKSGLLAFKSLSESPSETVIYRRFLIYGVNALVIEAMISGIRIFLFFTVSNAEKINPLKCCGEFTSLLITATGFAPSKEVTSLQLTLIL